MTWQNADVETSLNKCSNLAINGRNCYLKARSTTGWLIEWEHGKLNTRKYNMTGEGREEER